MTGRMNVTATDSLPPSGRWSDLGPRAASAILLVAVALATTWIGGFPFRIFWLAASIAVLWEWYRLTGAGVRSLPFWIGSATLVAVFVLADVDRAASFLVLVLGCGIELVLVRFRRPAWPATGLLYAGLFLAAVIMLRASEPLGARAIFWLFAVVWSCDVFAYLGGRLIGGPKLWPRISPSKTWSGTISGIVTGAVAGTAVATFGLDGASAAPIFALSFVAALLSQVGDACESMLKRHLGVKDSGSLIPGHGGVMDRLDGFVAASVFAFVVAFARGMSSFAEGLFLWS